MPGFGFSDKPDDTGWGISRIADAWIAHDRLGYERWGAQGGDWGSAGRRRSAAGHRPAALGFTSTMEQPIAFADEIRAIFRTVR
jgi:epoxide hydrolase